MPDQDYNLNLEIALFPATDENDLILLLDHIQDPGNIGTIIRIAEWFDIKTICCSMNTADVYNPKVVQSSMGSLFRTDIYYTDLIELLETNNRVDKKEKRLVYGTFPDGIDIYEEKLDSQAFVIIGNESKGISTPLEKFITTKLSIPRFTTQPIDSLNAAIATAIVCSEFRRRW